LDVFKDFTGGGNSDSVGSKECDIDVGNLYGEAGHVMLDDDMGLIVTDVGVMDMMGWEALASFSAVGATCTGTSIRPSCAGNAGVDGDAGPQESGSVGGLCVCLAREDWLSSRWRRCLKPRDLNSRITVL
jgi:hypothetical protein